MTFRPVYLLVALAVVVWVVVFAALPSAFGQESTTTTTEATTTTTTEATTTTTEAPTTTTTLAPAPSGPPGDPDTEFFRSVCVTAAALCVFAAGFYVIRSI